MTHQDIGSLTLMQRLYDNPRDPVLWEKFNERYKNRIYSWTRKWLRDPNDGDDVFMEICKKVYEIIMNDSRKRLWPRNNSYRPIIRIICENVCKDIASRKKKYVFADELNEVEVEDWRKRAASELFQGLNDLDDHEFRQLALYQEAYRDALNGRRTEPQYNPKTTEIFFKIYRDELSTARVNGEYGYTDRDTSRKQAQRELRRLVDLMKLPIATAEERARSEKIVSELAKVYGDLSDASD